MKPGLLGQQLSLMEVLRAASYAAHARLQTAPFFEALVACQLPLESYVGQLRALSVIHGVLERALDSGADDQVAAVWTPDMRKLPLLQQDLQFFAPRAVADLKEAVEAALETADGLRLRSHDSPLSLLGAIYVLEGATLGARVLRPLYARAFLLADEDGSTYLRGYGDATQAHWTEYRQRMNDLSLSTEECEQAAQAAIDLFARLDGVYQALYPFQPESKTFLVTSINPEAGRHPIPGDEREVQAALRAADRCWRRFPYYEERYGERGRHFARSDAAWLATLYPYEPAQIIRQVRWLGRVLAGRGMPTLLLQDQLEFLVEELTAAVPVRETDFAKLLLAADVLGTSRRQYLRDDQVDSLAKAFEQAVGLEWNARLPRTGDLLACAVTDDLEGIGNALASIQEWMTDAERFPNAWIAAVQNTLADAWAQAQSTRDPDSPQPDLRSAP
jgi:heme oxygenase